MKIGYNYLPCRTCADCQIIGVNWTKVWEKKKEGEPEDNQLALPEGCNSLRTTFLYLRKHLTEACDELVKKTVAVCLAINIITIFKVPFLKVRHFIQLLNYNKDICFEKDSKKRYWDFTKFHNTMHVEKSCCCCC